MVAERKYAMTRIEAGDYILPSNDRRHVLRISRYEDGPSHGLEEWPRDEKVWGVWKFTLPVEALNLETLDDWGYWEMVSGTNATRAEAIDEAMEMF